MTDSMSDSLTVADFNIHVCCERGLLVKDLVLLIDINLTLSFLPRKVDPTLLKNWTDYQVLSKVLTNRLKLELLMHRDQSY